MEKPLSFIETAAGPNDPRLIGSLNVTVRLSTAVLRGFGDTGVMETMDKGIEGGVVLLVHEVEREFVPGWPVRPVTPRASNVRTYAPSAAVNGVSPTSVYVLPEAG